MSQFGVNKLHEFVAHNTTVNCLTFGPQSNQVVATGGEDFNVNVWRVGNASNVWTLGQNKSPIECLCFDSDEQCIVSGAMNGSLKVFDLNEGKLARNLRGHQVNITTLDYHPYGEYIVSGSTDTTMKVWDVRNKTCIQTYTGHEKEVTCVRFSPDGRWVASSAKDGQVLFWDLVAGKLMHTIRMAPAYVTSFEFNPQEFLLAATTSMRTVRLWDMENFECIGTSSPEGSALRALSFTKDGTALCTASNDVLRVHGWDPVTSKGSTVVGWDKITEIRLTDDNVALCGSIISNFVSIWTVDIRNALEENAPVVDQSPPPKTATRTTTSSVRATRSSGSDAKAERKPVSIVEEVPPAQSDEKSPAVVWEEGHSAKEMASTMSESFDARQRRGQGGEAKMRPHYEEDDEEDPSAALERMLPPSSFAGNKDPSRVGVSPLQSRRPAPQAACVTNDLVGGRDEMLRGPDPLQPVKEAPLAIVGSSHGKRRPPDRVPTSSHEPSVAAARPKTNYSYESIAEEEAKKSGDLFEEVVEKDGRSMLAVLSHRRSSIAILRKHWERGEIDEVVSHLLSLQVMAQQDPKQLMPAADFFSATELRGHGMNLAACAKILPVLECMLDGNIEYLALASLRTMVTLGEVFGELIRQTRSVLVAGGVDLSREDRLQKCNACHTVLIRVRSRLDTIRQKYRKSRRFLEVVEKAQNMLDNIC